MATCWECETAPERLIDVTIEVPAGRACHLRLCPSCYQACYLPLVDMAAVELLHDVAPAAMLSPGR